MPSSDHNEMGKAHWGIRWETVRIQLADYWNLPDVKAHAEYNLQHWQDRQNYLFVQAQKESLND